MTNPLRQLGTHGQSPWYDFITRDLIASGELPKLAAGTTRPTSPSRMSMRSSRPAARTAARNTARSAAHDVVAGLAVASLRRAVWRRARRS